MLVDYILHTKADLFWTRLKSTKRARRRREFFFDLFWYCLKTLSFQRSHGKPSRLSSHDMIWKAGGQGSTNSVLFLCYLMWLPTQNTQTNIFYCWKKFDQNNFLQNTFFCYNVLHNVPCDGQPNPKTSRRGLIWVIVSFFSDFRGQLFFHFLTTFWRSLLGDRIGQQRWKK